MPTPSMLKEIGSKISSALSVLFGAPPTLKAAGDRQPFVPSYASNRPVFTTWSTDRAIAQGLKASVWVYACIRNLALSASIPLLVEKRVSETEWEPVPDHPLMQLLAYPNPHMSGQDILERTCYHLNLGGNALWHIVSAGTPPAPIELWPLPPDRIKPIPHETDWISGYEYRIGSTKRILMPEEVLHMQFVDPGNPYWGMSPLQAAARVVDTDVEAVRWNKLSLQNRAVTDGVFSFGQPMSREQWEEVREMVRDQHQGAEHAHDPWVLGYDSKYQQMSLSPVEMDFLASRRFHVSEICAVYGVPVVLLSPERTTFNNMAVGERRLWMSAIIPYLEDLCSALNLTLVPFWDAGRRSRNAQATLRIRPDTSNVPALHAILGEKVKTAKELWEMGVPFNMLNQRLQMGFEDVPDGDRPKPRSGGGGGNALPAGSAGALGVKANDETGSIAWADAERGAYWKAFDGDRKQWEGRLKELFAERFLAEGDLVANAFETNGILEAETVIEEQRAIWEEILGASYSAIMEHFGQLEGARLMREERAAGRVWEPKGLKADPFVFDPAAEAVQAFIARHAAQHVDGILSTTKRHIATSIGAGFAENETSSQIAKRIRDIYQLWAVPPEDSLIDTPRSMLIARTEAGTAANSGHFAGAKQTGLPIVKEWLTSRDDRVRDTHSLLDGTTAPLDETFGNGLLYPNDPNGSASEICNCRCAFANHVEKGK